MTFGDVLEPAIAMLQGRSRVSYRPPKAQFALDDQALDDPKFRLIEGQAVAADKDSKMLVWTGDSLAAPSQTDAAAQAQSPVSYPPPHLAERLRAEQAALEARGAREGE